MRPGKPERTGEQDLFRARLDQIINMKHELVRLAQTTDWDWIDGERRASILDPADDAPEITDDMLARAEVVIDGKIAKRGRPPIGD